MNRSLAASFLLALALACESSVTSDPKVEGLGDDAGATDGSDSAADGSLDTHVTPDEDVPTLDVPTLDVPEPLEDTPVAGDLPGPSSDSELFTPDPGPSLDVSVPSDAECRHAGYLGDLSYAWCNGPVDRLKAQERCASWSGHLAVPANEAELAFLDAHAEWTEAIDAAWTGLDYGRVGWVAGGAPATYLPWCAGQPGEPPEQFCVALVRQNDAPCITTRSCTETAGYFCVR